MARRAGGSLVRLARSQLWGGYSGYIADPDGHLWKVGANHRPSIFRSRRNPSLPAAPPSPSQTAVTLGCRDIKQSKAFYADRLGFTVDKSYGKFVSFKSDRSATMLSLYAWDALAQDAGVGPKGDGFRGIALSHLVSSPEHVDEILRAVREAGGSAAEPVRAPWGGYAGYFTDPSGHHWKVAARE
jgi:catechol 2,3-dioxygenase-like lactoylglutathione lyase family enzyme